MQEQVLAQLAAVLGERGILSSAEDCARYVTGARYGQGRTLAVLRPDSHEQVQQIAAICAQHSMPLVLQGANTGLVAAATPDASGRIAVLSLERLKSHIEIDLDNRSVTVDAGVSLQDLNDALEPHGLCFPIDLGANPSIGGMIAANTGGARLIKYGDVRHNLLGLRAVLLDPPGAELDLLAGLRKNNTGPDLKQLFVGSSGAYGVITRAVLQVHRLPRQSATALVIPRDQDAVLEILRVLERDCGEFLSAFEGMSGAAMQAVARHIPDLGNPFAPEALPEYAVLIELTSTSDPASGIEVETLLMNALENLFGDAVQNAVVGRGKDLWRIRHAISESIRHEGKLIAFDIAMVRSALPAFRARALDLLAQRFPYIKAFDFGHWADGGCHFNLAWPADAAVAYDAAIVEQIRTALYDLVVYEFGGSFSAEHGVGPYNQQYYQRYVSQNAKQLAGKIQSMLDPQGLLGLTRFGAQ
ncbi:FAD-binding oxidoreductase [Massilia sp. W12]|uniref:FAD-binding oxidoreductase n=1 Tax=Massilia sp. W12 TaxID=3126507 RepID=UPI0030D557DB